MSFHVGDVVVTRLDWFAVVLSEPEFYMSQHYSHRHRVTFWGLSEGRIIFFNLRIGDIREILR